MSLSNIDETYEEVKQDFRNYTGVEQELPDLEIVDGEKVFSDESPHYWRKVKDLEADCSRNPSSKKAGKSSDSWEQIHRRHSFDFGARKLVEFYGITDSDEEEYQYMVTPTGFENAIDRDSYSVVIGSEDVKNFDQDELYDLLLSGINLHAGKALEESFEPVKQEILGQYSHMDPNINIEGFDFRGLTDNALYRSKTNNLHLGVDNLPEFNIKEGKTNSERVEVTMYHEGIHAMQYATSPRFKEMGEAIINHTMEHGFPHESNVQAYKESATTFEVAREFGEHEGEIERVREIRRAWESGPEALQKFAEKNSERIKGSEYMLGQFTASIVNHAFRQESENPLEATREWLIHGVTVPNGYIGAIENAFNTLGLDIPDSLSELEPYTERL